MKTKFSRFSTPNQHLLKLVKIPITLNILSISISKLTILVICCDKYPTCGDCGSRAFHHENRLAISTILKDV